MMSKGKNKEKFKEKNEDSRKWDLEMGVAWVVDECSLGCHS